jgi:hypothetical protein
MRPNGIIVCHFSGDNTSAVLHIWIRSCPSRVPLSPFVGASSSLMQLTLSEVAFLQWLGSAVSSACQLLPVLECPYPLFPMERNSSWLSGLLLQVPFNGHGWGSSFIFGFLSSRQISFPSPLFPKPSTSEGTGVAVVGVAGPAVKLGLSELDFASALSSCRVTVYVPLKELYRLLPSSARHKFTLSFALLTVFFLPVYTRNYPARCCSC